MLLLVRCERIVEAMDFGRSEGLLIVDVREGDALDEVGR